MVNCQFEMLAFINETRFCHKKDFFCFIYFVSFVSFGFCKVLKEALEKRVKLVLKEKKVKPALKERKVYMGLWVKKGVLVTPVLKVVVVKTEMMVAMQKVSKQSHFL